MHTSYLQFGEVKKLLETHDAVFAGYVRAVLEENGVNCLVKNQFLVGGAGELPPTECWPEVWVIDDSFYPRAKSLVDSLLASETGVSDWRCGQCGEQLEPQFTECWQCGAIRPH